MYASTFTGCLSLVRNSILADEHNNIIIIKTSVIIVFQMYAGFIMMRSFTEQLMVYFKLNVKRKFRKIQRCKPGFVSTTLLGRQKYKLLGFHGFYSNIYSSVKMVVKCVLFQIFN